MYKEREKEKNLECLLSTRITIFDRLLVNDVADDARMLTHASSFIMHKAQRIQEAGTLEH